MANDVKRKDSTAKQWSALLTMLLWVGGRPKEQLDAAARDGKQLPGLHSPFWAPEADKVIAAGAEALAVSAMDLMPRK